jgi:riboflavin kinase / FMN adenylyltransferase
MRVFRSFDEATGLKNPVVTTGSFDGVHIGHKTIISRLQNLAAKYEGESVLITFHPHPRKVLYPDTTGKNLRLINSQEEKLMLLQKAGVDNVIIIEFTKEFARISSEEFVRDFLCARLRARVIVAGFNHHFGNNKEGDYRQLWNLREKYGFEAEEIPEQEVQHETVSSTIIRKSISEGYIQRANAYLDHYYLVMGLPEWGSHPINETGFRFYDIPVTDEDKLLPSDGIYAVLVETTSMVTKGMVVILSDGSNRQNVLLSTHFISDDISGRQVSLLFQKKITGPLVTGNSSFTCDKLRSSLDEISELIY